MEGRDREDYGLKTARQKVRKIISTNKLGMVV
jgi:hypothetical protein